MIVSRRADERGYATHGDWLKSWHTFSFANYYDPNHMNFGALRVINEDFVAPSTGFGKHPHRDMEILTYVLNGSVMHGDSMGNQKTVSAGEFQIMSAGTGVVHSEINPSANEELHLYQIWIMPDTLGIAPRYDQKRFLDKTGSTLILSPDAKDGSFKVYQDMRLWRYQLNANHTLSLDNDRIYWLQIVKGSIHVNGNTYQDSDALAIRQETLLTLDIEDTVEFLLFDLPVD